MDRSADTSADGQWLTYRELAKLRDIDIGSAKRLALRNHWRRQKGNTGREVRVLVPDDLTADTSVNASADATADTSADTSADFARVVSGFETALTVLREQLEQANQRANRLEAKAEATTIELRGQIEALQAQLAEAQRAVQGADELRRLDDARRAMTRWARLRAAWRGR